MKNLKDHKVFTWVERPVDKNLLKRTWAWKVKTDDQSRISKFKGRCVVQGFRQQYGIDYISSSSPVGKLTTLRVLVAEAARRGMDIQFLDIRSAYLTADMDIECFMEPPPGFDAPNGHVMRLDKALYGTKQGARLFHQKFRKDLIKWGFKASSADPCCFVKRKGESVITKTKEILSARPVKVLGHSSNSFVPVAKRLPLPKPELTRTLPTRSRPMPLRAVPAGDPLPRHS